ncbi:MAG: OmpA family protein [Verrucomicrobia bacterium]|nr:OmpA family protein [Verrucomicrobiota bacterium]MBS0645412.1 OmpA family protein [Verrucomicrobiota bacterium]
MKKYMIALAALCISTTACHRTGRETWEDTKTCGRYMGKGMRCLFGQHDSSPDFARLSRWSDESEFIPMQKQDAGYTALEVNEYTAPISRESPGDPDSALPGIEGFRAPSGKLAALFASIHFDTDQYTVIGDENLHAIREIAHYLISNPNTYVFVEGHADERGAAAYNLALGSRRANSVRTLLIQNGVNPDQLFAISYGKEKPVSQGHDPSSWKQNRRAQFKLHQLERR